MKIKCTFVAMMQTGNKKRLPNVNRSRKQTNPIVREIIVLERYNARIGIFTNVLGALGGIVKEIPSGVNVDLPSYSTVNRAIKEVGDIYNVPTPMGIYTIAKVNLYRFVL
jgi:hypothetical protein